MRYAYDEKGERIEVSYSKQIGFCKDCNNNVYGRKGRIRTPYWKHGNSDCDSWHEPITEWHLKWQDLFPEESREIPLIDTNTNEIHRADVRLSNGIVIEVQNSSISIDEIEARERFYGKKRMLWIINGKTLASHSSIKYKFNRKIFAINLEVPPYLHDSPQYNMDDFNQSLVNTDIFNSIRANENLIDFEINNGNDYSIEFSEIDNLSEITYELEQSIKKTIVSLYDWNFYFKEKDLFRVKKSENQVAFYDQIKLLKKYWRPFIDHMKYPVIIDNLEGLPKKHVYLYHDNDIISQGELIRKIMEGKI